MPQRKTHEEFVAEVKALVGGEYEVVGKYESSRSKIEVRHSICGGIYYATPNNFLRGKRCFECHGNKLKTTSQFKKEVRELVRDEYEVIGEYKNSTTKIEMRHIVCGSNYFSTPNNFLVGSRCPECGGTTLKTTSQFKKEIRELALGEYEVVGEYKNSTTKIEMRHISCGNKYMVKPTVFLAGSRCPKCACSKGEDAIFSWLCNVSAQFKTEYKIDECCDRRPLPFDFCVFDKKSIVCLIEYDGEQHYRARPFFGGELALRSQQRRDAIKTKYCADNNIPLIRIPYWEYDNIDAILTEKLLPLVYNADKRNAS